MIKFLGCGGLFAAMVLATSCADPPLPPGLTPQPVLAGDFAPVPFRCPDSTVMVAHWNADPVRYDGWLEGDPSTCQLRSMGGGAAAGTSRQLFMVFGDPSPTAPHTAPLAGEATIREKMAQFWPLRPGREPLRFTYLGPFDPNTSRPLVTEIWRVLGTQKLRLESINGGASGTRDTVMVERIVGTTTANFPSGSTMTRWTYWFDAQTSALLRSNADILRGVTPTIPVAVRQPAALSIVDR